MTNNLKRAIDTDLSCLFTTGREREMILENALEGKKVKRKLSAAFVLVMVLVLLASAAVAVVTIRETGRTIAKTEREEGDYIDWPAEKKARVVGELMEEGFIKETPERKQMKDGTLTKEDTARVADEAIEELTQEDAKYASFLGIMNAVWGQFSNWTIEQQAWYSQTMTDIGANTEGETYYVMPTGKMTREQAIEIAKREIEKGYQMEAGLIDQYRLAEASFQIPEFAEPGDTKAYWYVCLDTWHTALENKEGLPFSTVEVFIDPDNGMLLESIEEMIAARKAAQDRGNHPINVALQAFYQSIDEAKAFRTWTLEHKARWSREIAPLLRAYFAENDDENALMLGYANQASVHFTYGLPDEKAISKEQALAVSRDALQKAYSLSDEELSLLFDNKGAFYEPCVFYDVTDSEHPKWKFFCEMPSIYGSDDALAARVKALYGKEDHDRFFKTEIDAYTGEVVRTLKLRYLPSSLEGYIDIY